MSDQDDDDKVGYGKPPKKYRFRKGQSGNPKGRPKRRSLGPTYSMLAAMNDVMSLVEGGKRKKCTKLEIAMKQLANKAASGHLPTIKFIIEHLKKTNWPNPEPRIVVSFIDGKDEIDWEEFNRRAEEKKKKDED